MSFSDRKMGTLIMLLDITINLKIYHLGVINDVTNFASLGQKYWKGMGEIFQIFEDFWQVSMNLAMGPACRKGFAGGREPSPESKERFQSIALKW